MRVLIADDYPLLIDGLISLLEAHGIEVAGTANDGQAAVAQALRLEPDLVLMDIPMPVMNGLAATRLIKAQRPDMKIVILTTSAEDGDLFEAIKSGACGYLLKITSGSAFIEALHGLEQGVPPFSPGLAERLLGEFARLSESVDKGTGRHGPKALTGYSARVLREDSETDSPSLHVFPSPCQPLLTERQKEVLKLVAAGLTYKEVGARLSLSEVTVRYHMSEIMEHLHLEHRSQVIAYAANHKII